MNILSPSLLSADFTKLGEEIKIIDVCWSGICSCRCYGWSFCAEHFLRNACNKVNKKGYKESL